MKDGFRVLDSDMHVIEPPDLWQRYMPDELKGSAPVGPVDWVRDLRLKDADGEPWGMPPDMPGTVGTIVGKQLLTDAERYKDHHARGWTSDVQLEAMDAEGVDVAVLFPSRGLHAMSQPGLDPALAAAVARAYNDWMADFCEADRGRLFGVGMISPFDVGDAVAEARRAVVDLGFKGVFLRANVVNGHNWHDPIYEPLWSTLEELDVPVGFHEAGGSAARQSGDLFEPDFMLRHTYSHPFEQMLAVGPMCAGGVLERHPGLRVAFLEGNCSWAPWLLWRLDEHWEIFGDVWSPNLTMPPSEYFKRQCFVSVDSDERTVSQVIEHFGSADCIVFSTDYPHVDAKYPDSLATFLRQPLAEEHKRQILWDSCARLYGLEDLGASVPSST